MAVHVETKYLWLREEVATGTEIDGWRVCWAGGWDKGRFRFLVMVEKVTRIPDHKSRR